MLSLHAHVVDALLHVLLGYWHITLHFVYIIFCLFSNNRSIYPNFEQKWSTPRVCTPFTCGINSLINRTLTILVSSLIESPNFFSCARCDSRVWETSLKDKILSARDALAKTLAKSTPKHNNNSSLDWRENLCFLFGFSIVWGSSHMQSAVYNSGIAILSRFYTAW